VTRRRAGPPELQLSPDAGGTGPGRQPGRLDRRDLGGRVREREVDL